MSRGYEYFAMKGFGKTLHTDEDLEPMKERCSNDELNLVDLFAKQHDFNTASVDLETMLVDEFGRIEPVIIVGAGEAGSAAARVISQRGVDIVTVGAAEARLMANGPISNMGVIGMQRPKSCFAQMLIDNSIKEVKELEQILTIDSAMSLNEVKKSGQENRRDRRKKARVKYK